MSNCYNIKLIHESKTSLLNINNCYILTLENSDRLEHPIRKNLINLAKKTYVQYNKGYKNCEKENIKTPSQDVLHSYYNIFNETKHLNEPILILEDDAIIIGNNEDFKEVNKFLKNNKFSIYSLGSFGPIHFNFNKHKEFINKLLTVNAQAIIWNVTARKNMLDKLNIKNLPQQQMDSHYFKQIDNKFSYFKPLVVQAFPDTNNRKTWCYYCDNSNFFLSFFDKIIMNKYINILKQLNLEKENFSGLTIGWNIAYFILNNAIIILSIIILSIIILLIYKYKK